MDLKVLINLLYMRLKMFNKKASYDRQHCQLLEAAIRSPPKKTTGPK